MNIIIKVYYKIYHMIDNLIESVVFGFQRMFRGYDNSAYWCLHSYLTDIAIPVLKNMRDYGFGVPYNDDTKKFHTNREWKTRLNKMIKAFEIIQKDDWEYNNSKKLKKQKEIIKIGLKEFSDYFTALWD